MATSAVKDARGQTTGCSKTSHCPKKSVVNKLGGSGLPPHCFTLRCGWKMTNVHSLFDYLVFCANSDSQCALVLAGWLIVHSSGKRMGGYSPVADDIVTASEKAPVFINALFGEYVPHF